MRRLALVQRRVHMPALKLRAAGFKVGLGWRVLVPVIARFACGGEIFDAVGVGALVAFAYEADIWSGRDADHFTFL